ncbi:MAG: 2-amino-4-hydroxy-6-hydroxymethyldihydropteridine diphosphokinase [Aliidiomarina sp.]|uniref:2-amino-4-hydroxy-6- hydroxymethyldihydropteridine diphosphokinase n=1 Tax=Aliidiomarina sp. TaxID=1872439 RepID=UPI0025C52267|nr:2-amino-4-hydroxy-6-hydroxymethyldihydropteridine diphosphokinase [Aliidiomarina sp.]MCH8502162.1 2-amino-4-hydroxy-6-hydroxymethyldihydropteridine diphosphokinase [Aliidiomarina sp.]
MSSAAQKNVRVFLGLGSNLNREHNIVCGVRALESEFRQVSLSPIYESEAFGFEGPAFFNLVAEVQTQASLSSIQSICKAIELEYGRVESDSKYSSRTLDIDILLYGDLVQAKTAQEPALPRADVLTRAYVLKPLADLIPFAHYPHSDKTFQQLWREFQHTDIGHQQPIQRLAMSWSQLLAAID